MIRESDIERLSAHIAAIFGLILMGWIGFQLAWMGYLIFLQPLYFITGLIQFAAALIYVKNFCKTDKL